MRKPLHADTTAMFKITISQLNKYDNDSSTYQAFVFYSGKKIGRTKELYIDFPDFGYSYYRIGDSAFLFDKIVDKYYASDINKDSLLLYFDAEILTEVLEPIFMSNLYQPSFISSKVKDFSTNEINCIGLSYKGMPMGPLMSMGYEIKMTEIFAKPCTYNAVIDTITYCFKSLYMKMDTSKVMGNNPISMYYNFDKLETTSSSNDSIKKLIAKYKRTFVSSILADFASFEDYKKTERNKVVDMNKKTNPIDLSKRFSTPLLEINGDSLRLNDFKGKYILLDFWFTNCPPCMRGIPKVNAIYEKFKDRNLVVLGINPIDKKIQEIKDVVQKRVMKYTACKAPAGYEKYFDVPSYPRYILISPDQKIVQTIHLDEDNDLENFMKELEKKLK
jgi:thiol-disulfide isomerase/thioredoxin